MQTTVVNLFGGPGVGKSTLMAEIYAYLKRHGFHTEMAPEYAKDLVWEESPTLIGHQYRLHSEQLFRIKRLMGKVDFIVTDCPTLLSLVYEPDPSPEFKAFVLSEFRALPRVNFFLERRVEYSPVGRNEQDEESAARVDDKILHLLQEMKENRYYTDVTNPSVVEWIVERVHKHAVVV